MVAVNGAASSRMPIVPVAAANLPDGKVLTWSAYDRFAFGGNRGKTYTAIFDPATNTSQELLVSNTQHDMFAREQVPCLMEKSW